MLVLSKVDLVDDPEPMLDELRAIAPSLHVRRVDGHRRWHRTMRTLGGPARRPCCSAAPASASRRCSTRCSAPQAQLTQPIREDERGRHTTTRRELFVTEHGLWIDTPGMRELAQWIDDTDDDSVRRHRGARRGCKFRDCQHRAEPDCAVRAAVEAGRCPARLASFHKLADERATGAHKQEAAAPARRNAESEGKTYAPRPGKPDDER